MRVGVLSDTHDHLGNIDRAFDTFSAEQVAIVCHLGDWVAPYTVEVVARRAKELGVPLHGVLGNNDGEIFRIVSRNPAEWGIELGQHTLELTKEGRRIVLYHGTDALITEALSRSGQYAAVFTGHTHLPRNERVGNTLVLNPGTLSGFSSERGGRIREAEVAVYDTESNTARLLSFATAEVA